MSPTHRHRALFTFPMLPLNKKSLKRKLKSSHSARNFNPVVCEGTQHRHLLSARIYDKFPDLFDAYIKS